MTGRGQTMRVGLALGSGAARGWAHIGVIEELNRMGIKPDIVAGCSIGALVGGAYAVRRIDELKDFALSLDLFRMMNYFDLSFGRGGMIAGRSLSSWYGGLCGHKQIEDLEIDFASVATDIRTGREVWLRSGPMADAVGASIAIPGIFEPVRLGSRWLADGGIVNPVPISLARALDADIVIAVDLNADTFRPTAEFLRRQDGDEAVVPPEEDKLPWSWADELANRLPSTMKRGTNKFIRSILDPKDRGPQHLEVINNAIAIMGDRITRSRAAGDPPDIMITPALREIGILQFDRAAEAIDLGRKAVRMMRRPIEGLFGIERPLAEGPQPVPHSRPAHPRVKNKGETP